MVPSGAQERAGSTKSPTVDIAEEAKSWGLAVSQWQQCHSGSSADDNFIYFTHDGEMLQSLLPPAAPSTFWDCKCAPSCLVSEGLGN